MACTGRRGPPGRRAVRPVRLRVAGSRRRSAPPVRRRWCGPGSTGHRRHGGRRGEQQAQLLGAGAEDGLYRHVEHDSRRRGTTCSASHVARVCPSRSAAPWASQGRRPARREREIEVEDRLDAVSGGVRVRRRDQADIGAALAGAPLDGLAGPEGGEGGDAELGGEGSGARLVRPEPLPAAVVGVPAWGGVGPRPTADPVTASSTTTSKPTP